MKAIARHRRLSARPIATSAPNAMTGSVSPAREMREANDSNLSERLAANRSLMENSQSRSPAVWLA